MMKRSFILLLVAIVTLAVALLLIPAHDWNSALALCLGFILLGESAIIFSSNLLSQPSDGMLPWNAGMSAAPLVYFALAAGLFGAALGGVEWRILLSAHLVVLLLFGAAIAAIRSAGRRVVRTQKADDNVYDDLARLRARVGGLLDRLAALSLEEANTVEIEARSLFDRLRYATLIANDNPRAVPPVLLDAVQRMESAVEAMQRGDDRQQCLSEFRVQLKVSDAFLRRHRGTLT
jgi:hypothetical protein